MGAGRVQRRLQEAQAEEQALTEGICSAQLECETSNRCLAELTRVGAAREWHGRGVQSCCLCWP